MNAGLNDDKVVHGRIGFEKKLWKFIESRVLSIYNILVIKLGRTSNIYSVDI